MAKTRSQTGTITIKKEEGEDYKATLRFHSGYNTRSKNKITKRNESKNNDRLLSAQEIKVEQNTSTKSLLDVQPQYISQEQINRLIDYVVNHDMSVAGASRKVKMPLYKAHHYYKLYKNDPDKKVPAPVNRPRYNQRLYTQEHIENLIKYINNDKMSVKEASAKANLTHKCGSYYYNRYLKDPNHNIPVPRIYPRYTKDQKNEFIDYIVNGKMSIKEASKKANIYIAVGRGYYHEYFDDQKPDICAPSHISIPKRYTQEQISKVISYIVNDKMTINAASRKANIGSTSAGNYLRRYLKDNNMENPVSKHHNRYTQDQIDEFIRYIVDDKMLIKVASKKANMSYETGKRFYGKYVKDPNTKPPAKYTQDQINEMIGYIVNDKMTIRAAAKKANMTSSPSKRHYQKYLNDHNLEMHSRTRRREQINHFFRYMIDDKMSLVEASRKANLGYSTAKKYYRKYRNDQKRESCN